MIILVDMDGVLAHWDRAYSLRLKEISPEAPDYIPGKRDSYNIFEGFEGHLEDAFEALNTVNYAKLDFIRGCKKAIKEMIKDGHDVFICTAPTITNYSCASDKIAWVRRHFGDKMANRTIITYDKTVVHGDYLIDDKPSISGVVTNPSWKHIVFTASYNKNVQSELRMNSWSEWKDVVR